MKTYEYIYYNGKKHGIRAEGKSHISISEESADYRLMQEEIKNGKAELIDNPPPEPTAKEIEIEKALKELKKSDAEVVKNISRVIEDYYESMSEEQKALMYQGFRDAIADKKAKRKAYTDLL